MTKYKDEIKISKSNVSSSIIIYLFFTTIISTGIIFSEKKNLLNPIIPISLISFLLFLASRKLNVWYVSKRNKILIFKQLLRRNNYEINILEDLIEIDCEVFTEVNSDITHYTLILKTAKMNFKLSSEDYKNFDELLLEIFKENKTYLNDFNKLKNNKNRKAKKTDKTILIISIIIVVFFVILYKLN
jgi:hypothetical protein